MSLYFLCLNGLTHIFVEFKVHQTICYSASRGKIIGFGSLHLRQGRYMSHKGLQIYPSDITFMFSIREEKFKIFTNRASVLLKFFRWLMHNHVVLKGKNCSFNFAFTLGWQWARSGNSLYLFRVEKSINTEVGPVAYPYSAVSFISVSLYLS